jgi:hypothetical protein
MHSGYSSDKAKVTVPAFRFQFQFHNTAYSFTTTKVVQYRPDQNHDLPDDILMVEPGEKLHLPHDLLVEHLVPGVEADPLDRVRLIVQLVLHLLFKNTIQSQEAGLGIHNILVRIRISGSVPLTNGYGSGSGF